jgi:hypothetical protein
MNDTLPPAPPPSEQFGVSSGKPQKDNPDEVLVQQRTVPTATVSHVLFYFVFESRSPFLLFFYCLLDGLPFSLALLFD